MSTALPACHVHVVTVESGIRCVAVLDICVIDRMKATKFMGRWSMMGIQSAVRIGIMDAVFQ